MPKYGHDINFGKRKRSSIKLATYAELIKKQHPSYEVEYDPKSRSIKVTKAIEIRTRKGAFAFLMNGGMTTEGEQIIDPRYRHGRKAA